ncbi:hypothetical protein BAY61_32185 (plasmid) [Prauserella marina]|uniref:Uncharacterized protein n=1 Tax=Prauserella marina TaxID=530584 RepID=A0A222W1W9_9PSEU|nr:hypothetical protein [Prauserella marina]ASR39943.1 hypothetical protein BAY61_32185 [Prauserella marina]PWV71446.1 hypothetical protein DES30_112162 [Prauserella marina]SDD97479.1 hypothetical protein SAMN05421630_115117 [Prauserella marina]
MSVRQPVVAGVDGGVGARTLALALGVTAPPAERYTPCDVLVCRGTVHSLALAEWHVDAVTRSGNHQPVILAVQTDAEGIPRNARAKLTMLEPHLHGIVRMPWVSRWREVADPYTEAGQLLRRDPAAVPKHLIKYHAAVVDVAERLMRLVTNTTPNMALYTPGSWAPQPSPAAPGSATPFAFHPAGGH